MGEETKRIVSVKDILHILPNLQNREEAVDYILQLEEGNRNWKMVKYYAIPVGGVQELFPRTNYKQDTEALQQALKGIRLELKAQIENIFYVPIKEYEDKKKKVDAKEAELEKRARDYASKEKEQADKAHELADLEKRVKADEAKVTENHRKALQAIRESEDAKKKYENAKNNYEIMEEQLKKDYKIKGEELKRKEEKINKVYDALHNLHSGIEEFLKLFPQPAPSVGAKAVDDIFAEPSEDIEIVPGAGAPTMLDLGPIKSREPKPKEAPKPREPPKPGEAHKPREPPKQ
jgi:DNA repair exonuclease SbcCD ATPase subunit